MSTPEEAGLKAQLEFSVRMQQERERLAEILKRGWTFIGLLNDAGFKDGLIECPLCRACVKDKEGHTAWHLRNLQ